MSNFNDFLNKIVAGIDQDDEGIKVNPVELLGVDDDKTVTNIDKTNEEKSINKNHCNIFKGDINNELFLKFKDILSNFLTYLSKQNTNMNILTIYEKASNVLDYIYNLDKDYFSIPSNVTAFKNSFLKYIRNYWNMLKQKKVTGKYDEPVFLGEQINNISSNLRSEVRRNYFADGRLSLLTFLEFTKAFIELYLQNRKPLEQFFNNQYYNLKNKSMADWYVTLNPLYIKYMYFLGTPYNTITAKEKAKFVAEANLIYPKFEYDIKNALRNLYITYEDNKFVPVSIGMSLIGGMRGL